MKVKEFCRPKSLDSALALLRDKPNAKIIAGGTDLTIALNERHIQPDTVIDITGIAQLRRIYEADGILHIGSAATFSDVQFSPLVKHYCPSLCEAAAQMGATQVRNLATVGGNVANAATAADSLPPLLSMDGLAVVASAGHTRTLPVAAVVTGVNQNSLAGDELIVEFLLPEQPGTAKVFEKVGRRKALAISRINLGLCVKMDGKTVQGIAVAVGAVGKTAYRVTPVESFLAGKELSEETIAQAANLMDEVVAKNLAGRSTTPYKRKIAWAVLKRGLTRIAEGEGL